MSPEQNNISIIHNCEKHFFDWLKFRLNEKGVTIHCNTNLTDVLLNHGNELEELRQHLKPLNRWNKFKNECFLLSERLNGSAESDEYLIELMEKTAFEGQILWLTFQAD